MTDLSGWLTAADIHAVSCGRPPMGRRGYNEAQIEDFLDRAAAPIETLQRLGR